MRILIYCSGDGLRLQYESRIGEARIYSDMVILLLEYGVIFLSLMLDEDEPRWFGAASTFIACVPDEWRSAALTELAGLGEFRDDPWLGGRWRSWCAECLGFGVDSVQRYSPAIGFCVPSPAAGGILANFGTFRVMECVGRFDFGASQVVVTWAAKGAGLPRTRGVAVVPMTLMFGRTDLLVAFVWSFRRCVWYSGTCGPGILVLIVPAVLFFGQLGFSNSRLDLDVGRIPFFFELTGSIYSRRPEIWAPRGRRGPRPQRPRRATVGSDPFLAIANPGRMLITRRCRDIVRRWILENRFVHVHFAPACTLWSTTGAEVWSPSSSSATPAPSGVARLPDRASPAAEQGGQP